MKINEFIKYEECAWNWSLRLTNRHKKLIYFSMHAYSIIKKEKSHIEGMSYLNNGSAAILSKILLPSRNFIVYFKNCHIFAPKVRYLFTSTLLNTHSEESVENNLCYNKTSTCRRI